MRVCERVQYGTRFLFFPEIYRDSKTKILFKIVWVRPNKKYKNKKFFSRKHPTPYTIITITIVIIIKQQIFFILINNKGIPQQFTSIIQLRVFYPHQFAGPRTYVRGPCFVFCAPFTNFRSQLCALCLITQFPQFGKISLRIDVMQKFPNSLFYLLANIYPGVGPLSLSVA